MPKIRVTLRNKTSFDVKFLIGEKSFTLASNQISKVSIKEKVSIEARPILLGINSSFILGGLKTDTIVDCTLEKDNVRYKRKLALTLTNN